MKKSFVLLLIIWINTLVLSGQTYTLTDDDVEVDEYGFIQSCSYDFTITKIIIPETLDGKTILGISDGDWLKEIGVFGNKKITSVELPNTLKTIGDYAFKDNSITSISFPTSVAEIGRSAFEHNSLTDIELPDNVSTLKMYAFAYNSLVSVSLGNGVNNIQYSTFAYNNIRNLTIPAVVKYIRRNAFYQNKLINVTFEEPSHLFFIERGAFDNNDLLTDITLPTNAYPDFINYRSGNKSYKAGDKITDFTVFYYLYYTPYTLTDNDVVVYNGVIKSCSYNFNNKNIIIPDTLDGQAIEGIYGLTYDPIGDSNWVEIIGIFQAKGITSLILPETLKTIEERQFQSNFLTDLVIPKNVTSIGKFAFAYNDISNVLLSDSLKVIGEQAFFSNNLKNITIPNNVTTIKYECFASNKISILSIKEPSQILSIEKDAFNYYLDSITLPLHKNPKFSAYQLGSNILLENETVAYNRSVFKTILDRGYVLSYYHWSNSPSRYYTMRHFMEQDSVFVISDKGYANKTDYRFIGWNTEKDGSGKHYNVGDSLAMPAHNFSLYAHWMPNVKVTIKGYSPDCASKDNGYLELTSTAQQNITGFIIEKGTSFIIKPNEALVISNLASGTYNIIINIDDEILSEHKIIIPTIPELKSSVLVNGTKATFTIKGGTVPYQIVINGTSYKTETGYLETNKLKAGIYTAIINDANLCSESNILTFSVNNLICYPNPVTNGILNIILPRDPEDATYQAIIYSLKSEIIFTEVLNLESSNTTIDVSSLVEGSYLLNVVNNTGYNETVKFILNK